MNHFRQRGSHKLGCRSRNPFPTCIDSSVMAKVALGFRVKSGWAAAAVVSGPASSPTVLHTRHVDLCDSAVPESRQPFHAVDEAQGELELDPDRIKKRLDVVRHVTAQSLGKLLSDCRTNEWVPNRAGIVAGSLVDPSSIRSPHIRAHAMEGHLFRPSLKTGCGRMACPASSSQRRRP